MKLIRFFLISFLIAVVVVATCSFFVTKGIRKNNSDFYGKFAAACDSRNNTSLLLVGSSRVWHQLDPVIFDSVTGLNSYNYGVSAAGFKTCYNIILAAIENQSSIKAIVLNIDYNSFHLFNDPYKDAYYYPFVKNLNNLIMTDSGNINLVHSLKIFDIALYDDAAKFAAFQGWAKPYSQSQDYKGYSPEYYDGRFHYPPAFITKPARTEMDVKNVELFNKIIAKCKQQGIALFLVIAPYYKPYHPATFITNYDSVINEVNKIAKENDISILDYSNTPLSSDSNYFKDYNHMNGKGASIYSGMIATELMKQLRN